jgi:hypothetical protein
MVKTPAFYGLFACYFIGCFAGVMAVGFAKPLGPDISVEAGWQQCPSASLRSSTAAGAPFSVS